MIVFLVVLWRFLARFAPDPRVRWLVVLAYALGSMAMTYSILFYSHQLGAICIASAWMIAVSVVEQRRRPAAMGWAGLLAGAALLSDYQAVFAALPVAVYVVARLRPRGALWRGLAAAVAGAALPVGFLLVYHAICFGSPWRTGYGASTTYASFHQHGLLGLTAFRWQAFWGSLGRIDNGLIALSPWLLLAIPGSVWLWRQGDRATVLIAAAVTAILVLFVSSLNFWRAGWGVGPRYITAMLPFLLPAVAVQLQRWAARPVWLGLAAGLIGVGIAVYVLSSATFPYWPDSVRHPLYDVTFRLLSDDRVARSLGSVLGIAGVAGIVPYLAIGFGAPAFAIWRLGGARSLAIAVAVAAAIVVGYGQIPHGDARAGAAYRSVRAAVGDL
jgi:hypothetical protein